MHALGLMARGVAHDFNNTLAVILGFGELVLQEIRRVPEMEETSKLMEIIITAATDASQIVDRLREFHRSAGENHVTVPVDFNILVEQAVTFTKPRWENDSIGKDITIQLENQAGDSAQVLGDPSELREVLVNLIFNAIDALPQGQNTRCEYCHPEHHFQENEPSASPDVGQFQQAHNSVTSALTEKGRKVAVQAPDGPL